MVVLKTWSSSCYNQFIAKSPSLATANSFLLREPTRQFGWIELNYLYNVAGHRGENLNGSRLIKSDLLMIKRFQLLLRTIPLSSLAKAYTSIK